jgi:hypothetical protein
MAPHSCSTPLLHPQALPPAPRKKACGSVRTVAGLNTIASAAHNLTLDELATRLRGIGPLEDQKSFCYVVRTVRLINGVLVQTASAPNFDGGYITLSTCKHSMRATMPTEAWLRGVWIASMSSWDLESSKQQSLVYLMRVGESYGSHFELVQSLKDSGRTVTLKAKASTTNRRGDVMIPASAELSPGEYRSVPAYVPPMVGHAHREDACKTDWEDDIAYVSRGGTPAALLVGDPDFSFTWSKQMIRNARPGALRPYRVGDLGALLSNLEDFRK